MVKVRAVSTGLAVIVNTTMMWRMAVTLLSDILVAVPHRFLASHKITKGVLRLSTFMATAPPRMDTTTISDGC